MNDSAALQEQTPGSRTLRGGVVIHHAQRFWIPHATPPFVCAEEVMRGYAREARKLGDRPRRLAATDLAYQLVLRYELGRGAISWATE